MTVLGLRRPESSHVDNQREGGVIWRLAPHQPPPNWKSLGSSLPNMAYRCRTSAMRALLDGLLCEERWDTIVFDSLVTGWALAQVQEACRRIKGRPTLVYVSHNHEESLRRGIVSNRHGVIKRQAHRLDAMKVARLERALVHEVDLVTAITPEDGELYRMQSPGKPVVVLTPGYGGRSIADRCITAALPRRAVMVGSFDWTAKRLNLEEFLRVADPIFAKRGIELWVVGNGEASYFEELQKSLTATRFTGRVDRVEPYVENARLAVVAERNGGGFKLKVLDYVFNRVPIVALRGSIAGVPLRDEESILLYPDQQTLALGISQTIDDVTRLDGIQRAAFEACRHAFDWRSRGAELLSAIAAL
jgi:glycosyltransferase involved in cell wall biosynthesis